MNSLRRRGGKKERSITPETQESPSSASLKETGVPVKPRSEWDYRLAIVVLTLLAFVTRFYGISYPAEVVFDEVHFGKVCF